MADDGPVEDYPTEIEENLNEFDSSVTSVQNMVQSLICASRSNHLVKLNPLDQAKLDLMSVYALNSMFWMYLVTQGVNPKDHGIKQELNTKEDILKNVVNSLPFTCIEERKSCRFEMTRGRVKDDRIFILKERIRTCMNKVKEIADKKKAARLNTDAASRFVRNALWDAEDKKRKDNSEHSHRGKHKRF